MVFRVLNYLFLGVDNVFSKVYIMFMVKVDIKTINTICKSNLTILDGKSLSRTRDMSALTSSVGDYFLEIIMHRPEIVIRKKRQITIRLKEKRIRDMGETITDIIPPDQSWHKPINPFLKGVA